MQHKISTIFSPSLGRHVKIHILETKKAIGCECITILFNDGQDFAALKMANRVAGFEVDYPNVPVRIIGLEAGDRINEYGTMSRNDYKNRGNKAQWYNLFINHELFPYLYSQHKISLLSALTGFAGFSLGGLSAMDIVLHNPDAFSFSGIFSGSFWWRHTPFTEEDPDGSRILHEYIDNHDISTNQHFWFQAGAMDEESDRNRNGIIDSIDDTLDVMQCLERKGYRKSKNMSYLEVSDGTHDTGTWHRVMPDFFDWVVKSL